MTDAIFQGWLSLSDKHVTLVRDGVFKIDAQIEYEADCIPDWAALAVAVGLILALGGFISAWINDRWWPTTILAVGLIIAAIGMRAAENAIDQKAQWHSI